MADTIGTAYVQVEPSFEGGVSKIDKEFGGMGESGGASFSSGFGKAMKGFGVATAAAGAAITAIGTKFVDATGDVASYGDNIDKMSQKMGLTADAYQEWDAVMQHSGTSMETMKASMKTLANAAQTNNKAFKELGITEQDLATMNQEQLFEATIAGLQNVTDTTQRTYLAGKLLGRGATELGALLNTSAEDTQAMRDRVRELGGVMSQDAVKAAAAYQDQLQDMQTAFQGLSRNLMSEFLPSMTEVMSGLTEIFAGNTEGGLGQISEGINHIVEGITQALPQIAQTATGILEALGTAIIQNLPALMQCGFQILQSLVTYIIQSLPEILRTGLEILKTLGQGIIDALPELIPMITEVFLELVTILTDPGNLQMIIESAVQIILALADGLLQALPQLIAALPQVITSIVTALTNPETLSALIQGAIQLVTSITQSLPTIIQALVDAIPQIIEALTTALTNPESLATLIEGFIQLAIALAAAFPEIFMALVEAVPQIVMSIGQAFLQLGPQLKTSLTQACQLAGPSFDQLATFAKDSWAKIQAAFAQVGAWFGNRFKEAVSAVKNAWSGIQSYFKGIWEQICSVFADALSRFSNIGKNIVGGIKDGIANAWDSLVGWFSDKIGGLLDTAEEVLDIESPSKKFRDEVGRWIPAGIAVGIEEGMGVLKKTTAAMSNEILDTATMNLQVGSAYTVPNAPDMSNATDGRTMNILAEYLPIIAKEISRPIEVKQNDRGMFEAVRTQNTKLVTATGYHALA